MTACRAFGPSRFGFPVSHALGTGNRETERKPLQTSALRFPEGISSVPLKTITCIATHRTAANTVI